MYKVTSQILTNIKIHKVTQTVHDSVNQNTQIRHVTDKVTPIVLQNKFGVLDELGSDCHADSGCINNIASNMGDTRSKSKLGFYVPFNSQGHIGTGPQNCHLWDSNPQR